MTDDIDRILVEARKAKIRFHVSNGELGFTAPNDVARATAHRLIETEGQAIKRHIEFITGLHLPPSPMTGPSIQQSINSRWIDQLTKGFANIVVIALIPGTFDQDSFAAAVSTLVDRHESLRTRYKKQGDHFFGVIQPTATPEFQISTIDGAPPVELIGGLLESLSDWAYKDLDLGETCLLACKALVAEQYAIVALRVPHFISDGQSAGLLFREFSRLYEQARSGGILKEERRKFTYDTYVRNQGNALVNGDWIETISHWKNIYNSWDDLIIPAKYAGDQAGKIGSIELFVLSGSNVKKLVDIAKSEFGFPELVITAIIAASLSRWAGQEKWLLTSVYHGRNTSAEFETLGLFATDVVFPIDCSSASFRKILKTTFSSWIAAIKHGGLPAKIAANATRREKRSMLTMNVNGNFSVAAGSAPPEDVAKRGEEIKWIPFPARLQNATDREGLGIVVQGNSEMVRGHLYYSCRTLNKEAAESLKHTFEDVIADALL